jgi:fatty-acid desaturase
MKFNTTRDFLVIPMLSLTAISLLVLVMTFSWWMLPTILFGWFITGCIGTEIGLHRLYSHKAFSINSKPMKYFILFASIMGGQGSPILWAAMHRGYHHPFTDKDKDLHSPTRGVWSSYMGWLFTTDFSKIRLSYAKDLYLDKEQNFVHKHYLEIFWVLMACFCFVLGLQLFCIAIVLPVFLAMQQVNLLNSLGHMDGWYSYRNFETNDNSVNNHLMGWMWGQGYHNNHHAKPNLIDFGVKSNEIDICRWIIPALIWIDQKCSK